jgi:hypothetical protein
MNAEDELVARIDSASNPAASNLLLPYQTDYAPPPEKNWSIVFVLLDKYRKSRIY